MIFLDGTFRSNQQEKHYLIEFNCLLWYLKEKQEHQVDRGDQEELNDVASSSILSSDCFIQ